MWVCVCVWHFSPSLFLCLSVCSLWAKYMLWLCELRSHFLVCGEWGYPWSSSHNNRVTTSYLGPSILSMDTFSPSLRWEIPCPGPCALEYYHPGLPLAIPFLVGEEFRRTRKCIWDLEASSAQLPPEGGPHSWCVPLTPRSGHGVAVSKEGVGEGVMELRHGEKPGVKARIGGILVKVRVRENNSSATLEKPGVDRLLGTVQRAGWCQTLW